MGAEVETLVVTPEGREAALQVIEDHFDVGRASAEGTLDRIFEVISEAAKTRLQSPQV